jgi:hypothetical protein
MSDVTQAARFAELAARLVGRPEVEEGTGFGRMPGLRVNGKIFVMLCRGQLVVKLPRARVDELVVAGVAERFDAGKGSRIMKEWASVPVTSAGQWEGLAEEALRFVLGRGLQG